MGFWEVWLPSDDLGGTDMTLRVEAMNWMGALRSGLKDLGGKAVSNIVCEVQDDNSIVVSEPASGRVFRIRQIEKSVAMPAPKTPTGQVPRPIDVGPPPVAAPTPVTPTPASTPVPSVQVEQNPSAVHDTIQNVPFGQSEELDITVTEGAAVPSDVDTSEAAKAPQVLPPPKPKATPTPMRVEKPQIAAAKEEAIYDTETIKNQPFLAPSAATEPVEREALKEPEPRKPSRPQFESAPKVAQRTQTPSSGHALNIPVAPSIDAEEVISELFFETADLASQNLRPKQIAKRILDMAMRSLPAQAGTFYLADLNENDLTFAAVRGPKAKEILSQEFTIPVGQGIAGFCAQEGVCLNVRDLQKDNRYFSGIADAVGHKPHDMICTGIQHEGRLYGALQLIDAKTAGGFDPGAMEVLRSLGMTAAELLADSVERESA